MSTREENDADFIVHTDFANSCFFESSVFLFEFWNVREKQSLDFVVLRTTLLKYFWILLAAPYHCSRRWLFQALKKEFLSQLMQFYIAFCRLARANLLISFSWKSSQFSKQNWPRALKIRLTKFKLAHAQVMSMQKFSVWRDLWL